MTKKTSKLIKYLLLMATLVFGYQCSFSQAPPPANTMTALDPNGIQAYLHLDSSGNLNTTGGGGGGLFYVEGYVPPWAPMALAPNGTFQYLNLDSSGNLKTTGGGSMTWPLTPGIPVCTGTPCAAWGTTLPAPDGNAAHFLNGLGAWAASSGGGNPATVGITQWNGSAWGTSYYNAGNAAPRLTPTYLPTENTPSPIVDASGYSVDGWIGALPDGKLVLIYQTETNSNHFVNASMSTSTDQGQTWSAAANILSGNATTAYYCCDGMVTNTGRIVIAYSLVVSGVYQGLYSNYSDDEGATWSAPAQVASSTYGGIYSGGTVIGNGYLLIPAYIEGATNTSYVYISQDNGATWGSPITVVSSTTGDYSEGSYAYLGGSTILGMIRCDGGVAPCIAGGGVTQVLSTDNGATWSIQGTISIDSEGNSPWLSTFMGLNGRRVVEWDYQQRSTSQELVEYGYAADLIASGTAGWQTASLQVVGTFPYCGNYAGANGYPSVVHPYDSPFGIGNYYQYNTAGCPSAGGTSKVFYTVPVGNLYPLNAEFGTQITVGGKVTSGYAYNDKSSLPMTGNYNPGGGYNTDNGCYNINSVPVACAFGSQNIGMGDIYSGSHFRKGSYDTEVGWSDNASVTTGLGNSCIAALSCEHLTTGSYNTCVGADACNTTTTGDVIMALGYGAVAEGETDTHEDIIGSNAVGHGSYTATYGDTNSIQETFISGIVRTGGLCTIDSTTGPIALTSSGTPVPICSWSVVYVLSPQVFTWTCQGTYSVSTLADTLSLGMNVSWGNGLTSETGNASINSTLTGTSTQNSVTSTSTGNQNILTGGTVSGATNLPFSTSGTLTHNGNQTVFSITATITGSSPTAQINPGTSCTLQ